MFTKYTKQMQDYISDNSNERQFLGTMLHFYIGVIRPVWHTGPLNLLNRLTFELELFCVLDMTVRRLRLKVKVHRVTVKQTAFITCLSALKTRRSQHSQECIYAVTAFCDSYP